MHEFPEVQALVRQACAQTPAARRIRRLIIVVGEASGHDPAHIADHFVEAALGTPAEGATLEFISEKLAAQCARCGAAFAPAPRVFACPQCGATELAITAGQRVRLAKVEVAEPIQENRSGADAP
jgi:hydrogenase nickel incorporation protein HypA/HybF